PSPARGRPGRPGRRRPAWRSCVDLPSIARNLDGDCLQVQQTVAVVRHPELKYLARAGEQLEPIGATRLKPLDGETPHRVREEGLTIRGWLVGRAHPTGNQGKRLV